MAEIGRFNSLIVLRSTPQGLYLDGGEHGDILLPKRYVPSDLEEGTAMAVFVMRDSEPYYWIPANNLQDPQVVNYALPMAAPDEILIEKTPDYSQGGYATLIKRATAMKERVKK